MTDSTPEDRARAFAARWFKNESRQLREIGCREIATLIREAIEAEKEQSTAVSRGRAPKSG
jgi:hypothetical protein